ncbi:MAG: AI-2E family transporter [Acidobacteriota bacterium]
MRSLRPSGQPDRPPRRALSIDISFATFLRALAAVALAWIWWQLWQWLLIFVLAVFLAIALDPAVQWLERRGLARRYGGPLIVLAIVLALAGFLGLSGASLVQEGKDFGQRLGGFRDSVATRIPPGVREAGSSLVPSSESLIGLGAWLVDGLAGFGVALVVTVYLLLDGRRTYQWLVAFVPAAARPRAHETAACASRVIASYVRGNLFTSLLSAVFTWIALAAMHVPAALVLALLAGMFDLVPVIGLFLSAAPAIVLGLSVSPAVGLGVALFYVLYNLVENYYIQPAVYGKELRLSDLVVISAFLVGGTLGGVLGAVIALPIAGMYADVERIWFDRPGGTDPADEHRRVQAQPEH